MIVISLILLLVDILAAVEFNSIANLKGYPGAKYGLWCAFFPFAGYLMVVALPTCAAQDICTAATNDILPEL